MWGIYKSKWIPGWNLYVNSAVGQQGRCNVVSVLVQVTEQLFQRQGKGIVGSSKTTDVVLLVVMSFSALVSWERVDPVQHHVYQGSSLRVLL